MRWDIFCRVIDNFGDIGVCWRLARQLASRDESVRLWVDDASALAWMAPHGAAGVEVLPWPLAPDTAAEAGDVVIEAFGCDLPHGVVAAMARRSRAPVWINLEYLSAEAFALRAHGLPSPQSSGPGRGLAKWFFYPGFGDDSGGLIREDALCIEQAAFDRQRWLRRFNVQPAADESIVSLFCYEHAPLAALLALPRPAQSTQVLLTAGIASRFADAIAAWPIDTHPVKLPLLGQSDFDRLLWSSDLNLVRGEDSLVRAIWAGDPFVWQIYPQADGAHVPKLHAFLDRYLADAPALLADAVRHIWLAWNGLGAWPERRPSLAAWRAHALAWRDTLLRQTDLCTRLQLFVEQKR